MRRRAVPTATGVPATHLYPSGRAACEPALPEHATQGRFRCLGVVNLGSAAQSGPAPAGYRPVEPSAQRAAGGSVLAGSSSSPAASIAAGRGGVLAGVVAPGRRRAAFRWAERLGAPAVDGRAVGGRRRCLGWCPIERDGIQRGGQRRSAQRAARRPGVSALSANGRLVRGPAGGSVSNSALARQPAKAAAPTAISAGHAPCLPHGAGQSLATPSRRDRSAGHAEERRPVSRSARTSTSRLTAWAAGRHC